jgi:hypothetical protein
MPHPLIDQFRFTRSEWLRGLEGVSEEDAARHFGPMNCISWTVGHMAWHEQRTLLTKPSGKILFPALNQSFAYGAPMSTPSLVEMRHMWHAVTEAVDPFLDSLTTRRLNEEILVKDDTGQQSVGSALRRVTYHYWYHIGETQAIRQMLGHRDLPEYVGDIEIEAPYRPE